MLTSSCNLACTYCIAKDLQRTKMSKATATRAIELFVDLAQGAHDLEVVFTGGEPLLRQGVFRLLLVHTAALAHAAGMQPHFVLKTNGTLLSERVVVLLKRFAVKTVVSIDGGPGSHDAARRLANGRPTQAEAMVGLRRLVDAQVDCVASMTVDPTQSQNIIANVQYLIENGIRRIDIGPAYGTVVWSPEQIKALSDSFLSVARLIRDSVTNATCVEIGPVYRDSEHSNGGLTDVWGCHAGSSHLAFLPNGDIAGCSSLAMLTPKYPELLLGDVGNGVDAERLRRFLPLVQGSRRERPSCTACRTAANCSGGCLAINLAETGSPYAPPAVYCECLRVLPKALAVAWN